MIVYTDLDGTMVGPRGCFFRAEDRSWTLAPSRALVALLESGGSMVLVSGRSRAQLIEAAQIFGADGFIAELGAMVGWDFGRSVEVMAASGPPADSALVEALLTEFKGQLEFYEPWHLGHEIDVMLRGAVPLPEVQQWLAEAGAPHLELRDNGVLPPRALTGLSLDGPLRVYHLVPAGISKGAAVAWDLARRGLSAKDAIAIGDSVSDLEMAPAVGRMFVVANGAPHLSGPLADNVTVTDGSVGLGWAEAVLTAC